MGLKVLFFNTGKNPEGRWNQTKMGLKDQFCWIYFWYSYQLKSDQNGIESLFLNDQSMTIMTSWNQTKMGLKVTNFSGTVLKLGPLKSDQNGIESSIAKALLMSYSIVEIRPKWDWKRSKAGLSHPLTSWNQTKMGLKVADITIIPLLESSLKSDQNGIERNVKFAKNGLLEKGWNQTKMGLKGETVDSPAVVWVQVEIRPKWDWKKSKN